MTPRGWEGFMGVGVWNTRMLINGNKIPARLEEQFLVYKIQ